MKDAKLLLDDFNIQQWESANLIHILRNHRGRENMIENPGEQAIRDSYDSLFDFFTKLSYYKSNDLISDRELTYFKYYIDKIRVEDFDKVCEDKKKEGARIYILTYFEREDFELLFNSVQ